MHVFTSLFFLAEMAKKSQGYSPDLHAATREDIFYCLVMYPYPSGYGLHVGHASNYTINDVMARFKRLQGKTVFNPFGFDSFGLPTENYAMKVGKPAYEVTQENIEYFLKQVEALNMSFDMERMVVTSNPDYYKRTQRIFQQLYKAGLVYRDELRVNRCPECQTVLANDQVVEGKCERCKSEIIQKKMPQWFIKITAYAERLLNDLEMIDRPEETKTGQRNRIGRSEGAEIDFEVGQQRKVLLIDAIHSSIIKKDDSAYGENLTKENLIPNKAVWQILDTYECRKIVVTNAPKHLIEHVLENESYDEIFTLENNPSKKDTAYYETLVKHLGVNADEIFYFEHNEEALESAKRAGIKNVLQFENVETLQPWLDASLSSVGRTEITLNFYNQKTFDAIKNGTKTIETRALNPEEPWRYFGDVKVGEILKFVNRPTGEFVRVRVTETFLWNGFEALRNEKKEVLEKIFRDKELLKTIHSVDDLRTYRNFTPGYAEKIEENGLVGFGFEIIEQGTLVTVFTTRPDTLYGVTALVLAPENTLIDQYLPEDKKTEVEAYRKETLSKTAVQRQQDSKDKTGMFSGVYAKHPLTGASLPVRYADYVLPDYATGSVMLVPAHDERDHEFATKFSLPIREVIKGEIQEGMSVVREGTLIDSDQFNGLSHTQAKKAIVEHLEKRGVGKTKITYRLRDWSVSRQRYRGSPIPVYYAPKENPMVPYYEWNDPMWKFQEGKEMLVRKTVQGILYNPKDETYAIIHMKNGDYYTFVLGGQEEGEMPEEAARREIIEETGFLNIKMSKPLGHYQEKFRHALKNRNQYSIRESFLFELVDEARQEQSLEAHEDLEVLRMTKEEILQLPDAGTVRNYFLRLASGEEIIWEGNYVEKYNAYNPIPQSDLVPHLIPEEELPVVLPLDVQNYKPKGKSPLEDHPTFPWYTAKDGKIYKRECDTLDTFMCSSFYFLRYPDARNDAMLCDPTLLNKMFPIELYIGGKEHTVGHLLYSRFIHKFLYDQGYVSSPEPFQKLVHQGMVLGADGRKMSKRRGNIIDPLEVIEKYGADAVRTYLMFMGPVEQDKARNDNALKGVAKFLQRIAALEPKTGIHLRANDAFLKKSPDEQEKAQKKVLSTYHKTIKTLSDDMEKMKFNTAVSKLMILVNAIYDEGVAPHEVLDGLAIMIAPFATDLSQQLRTVLGHAGDIYEANRPIADLTKIADEEISLPVQINGKMRGNVLIEPGTSEETALEKAREVENIAKYLAEGSIKKVIYVQDKILNIIL